MGIKDLISVVRKAILMVHLSQLSGMTVALDISIFYYKASYKKGFSNVVPYITRLVKMLHSFNIEVIGVFDGPTPELKEAEKERRRAKRIKLIGAPSDPNAWSNLNDEVQTCLTKLGVTTIHAPGEADSELAFLANHGIAHVVITEDTDLITLGCMKVLFKLDITGRGELYDMELLSTCFDEEPHLFDFMRFKMRCILLGCDYIKRIKGVGPKRIDQIIATLESSETSIEDIIKLISEIYESKFTIEEGYLERFNQAMMQFTHPVVYDPTQRKRVHLAPLPLGLEDDDVKFLGDLMIGEEEDAMNLALGNCSLADAEKIQGSFWNPNYTKPPEMQICQLNGKEMDYVVPPRNTKCTICGRNWKTPSALNEHMIAHSEERHLLCCVCGLTFKWERSLKVHLMAHAGDKPFKCTSCDYASTTKCNLDKHLLTHSGEKPYNCPTCNYASTSQQNLNAHLRTHTGEKPYKCTICDYASAWERNLIAHARTHTEDKPYKCSKCNFTTKSQAQLKVHEIVHSEDKPYKCSKCDFATKTLTHLKVHKLVHSEDKPYKCSKCDFATKTLTHLKVHKLVHSEDKPYKCSKCDFATKSQTRLKVHQLKHSTDKPHKCPKCEFVAKSKSEVTAHQLKHSDDKPHKCPKCNYAAKTNGDLKKHQVKHSEERPHQCKKCIFAAKTKSDLKKHENKHN